MLFEELTATQRAVLLLRKLCDYTTRECAEALSLSESNVKTTLRRAHVKLSGKLDTLWEGPDERSATRHGEALFALMEAVMRQDVERIEALLHEDVVLTNDAGGEFIAALRPILGRDRVLRFLLVRAAKTGVTRPSAVAMKFCNGVPALLFELEPSDARFASRQLLLVQLDANADRIAAMELLAQRRKLEHLFV